MAKTVAIIGASPDRSKFSNKAVRAFVKQGYTVVPVHPKEASVEGLTAYKSIADIPGTVDVASLYLPPAVGIKVLDEIARKGVAEVWLNPGADSDEVIGRARELKLNTIVACSILGIGESPSSF